MVRSYLCGDCKVGVGVITIGELEVDVAHLYCKLSAVVLILG